MENLIEEGDVIRPNNVILKMQLLYDQAPYEMIKKGMVFKMNHNVYLQLVHAYGEKSPNIFMPLNFLTCQIVRIDEIPNNTIILSIN